MQELYIEHRTIAKTSTLSEDVAHHLFTRHTRGRVVIVTDRPSGFMGAVKKQWSRVVRHVQNERSRTLDVDRIRSLNQEVTSMQQLSFSAKPSTDDLEADINFATLAHLLQIPPVCYTLYVACHVQKEDLYLLTAWMPPHSLVVIYDTAALVNLQQPHHILQASR